VTAALSCILQVVTELVLEELKHFMDLLGHEVHRQQTSFRGRQDEGPSKMVAKRVLRFKQIFNFLALLEEGLVMGQLLCLQV